MKEFYKRCIHIYDQYRESVPSYASVAFAFYLLLILIPAASLVAVGTSFLNIDMSIIEEIIRQMIMPEYANYIIEILDTRTFDTVALVTIVVSLYTVSRGVRHIDLIARNMYQYQTDESIVSYYIYSFKITIILLLLFIGLIAVLAIGPLAYVFHFLYHFYGIRHIILFFLMVLCLMIIYKIVPRVHIHYEDAFEGALVSSTLMLILYYALNIYFEFAHFQSVYGPLAFIVAILFVLNWAAEVFYIGMYMTHMLHERRKENEERTSRN